MAGLVSFVLCHITRRLYGECRIQFVGDLVIATPDIYQVTVGPGANFVWLETEGLWGYLKRVQGLCIEIILAGGGERITGNDISSLPTKTHRLDLRIICN